MKKLKDLNLEDDFLFSKVMRDESICKEFLEKLLEVEIEKIEMPINEKTINSKIDSKGVRLDIYVKDKDNTVYNIEMQRTDQKNLAKRLRYYQSSIDQDNIEKGHFYNELPKSYIIFICTFDYFGYDLCKYEFQNVCIEKNIKLDDGTNKIILNTKGKINNIKDEIKEFLEYVENSNENVVLKSRGELIKNIHKKVEYIKDDRGIEVEFMTLIERDMENREEGFLEGMEKGKAEGKEEEKVIVTGKLLERGLSLDEISDITGLTIEKIEEIKKEIE